MTCPKCGAPQGLPTAVSPPPLPAWQSVNSPPSGYSAVPWFRRRWFIILCVLTFPPITGVLALTGPLYFSYKSHVSVFQKDVKIALCIASVASLFQLVVPASRLQTGFYVIAMFTIAIMLAFKKQRSQDSK